MALVAWNSNSRPESVIVGRQQRFYELPAAIAGTLLWLGIFITERWPVTGLEYVWILAVGLPLGAWAVLMRLRIQGSMLLLGDWSLALDREPFQYREHPVVEHRKG